MDYRDYDTRLAAYAVIRDDAGRVLLVVGQLLGVHTFVLPPHVRVNTTDRPLKSVRVVFEARIVGGELRHEIGGTTDEARWFDPGAISDLPRVSLVDIALGMAH